MLEFPRTAAALRLFSLGGLLHFSVFSCSTSPLYAQVLWLLLAASTLATHAFPTSETGDRLAAFTALYGAFNAVSSVTHTRHVYGSWAALSVSYGIPSGIEWLLGVTPYRMRRVAFALAVGIDIIGQHASGGGRAATFAAFLACLTAWMSSRDSRSLLFHGLLASFVHNSLKWQ